jgi:hypothetical protein
MIVLGYVIKVSVHEFRPGPSYFPPSLENGGDVIGGHPASDLRIPALHSGGWRGEY